MELTDIAQPAGFVNFIDSSFSHSNRVELLSRKNPMSFVPDPTPGNPPKGPPVIAEAAVQNERQIAHIQHSLDQLKVLVRTLQDQLDCLKGCESE